MIEQVGSWRPRRRREADIENVGGIRDDELTTAEQELRLSITAQARSILAGLVNKITDQNAPRVLRLVQHTAEVQLSLLSQLSLGGIGPSEIDADFTGLDTETYGSQAIEHVMSSITQAQKDLNGPPENRDLRDLSATLSNLVDAGEGESEAAKLLREKIAKLAVKATMDARDEPELSSSEEDSGT